jgi:type II secretory ATPase GspE/PulE/Tfp pilus assembly ATPase PilB-like protein
MPSVLDATLSRINRQSEEEAAQKLAASMGMSYATLDDYPFNFEILSMIPLEEVEQKLFAAYVRSANRVRIAMVHPENQLDHDETTALGHKWGLEVERIVVSPTSMRFLITSYLRLKKEQTDKEAAVVLEQKKLAEHDYLNKVKTLGDLQQQVEVASVTEVLDVIIAAAYNQQASDIHLEPGEEFLTVRFRIDGVLQKVLQLTMQQHHQLLSRIKMLSGIKLDTSSIDQDGRFSQHTHGINADFRVSIVPTGYGAGIVMRILRQDMEALNLVQLGFSQHNLDLIEKALKRPYGLIVVTGPTGSGKSTTLYAMLQKLNSPEKKIITLEDPIEYRLEGLQQSQIDADKGFTFAEGLKGALRQDPDVVMVGEIRDPETATIALNASLTGHLVLSTLHTNDAVTAHARFLELGVASFLLSGSVQMIIAQRLVRVLAPESTPENPVYKRRLVIAEVLCPTKEFEQAVIAKSDQATLHELAVKGGMIPMVQDGLEKVKAGLTTEQEVYRVTTF